MQSLQEDIKTGKWKPVYLLYGQEDYLKNQYRVRLTRGIVQKEDAMNYALFTEKGVESREIIELANTMPFFAERRLVVLVNSGFLKKGGEELAEYLSSMPKTTCLLFVEHEVDKRSKLYRAIQKQGRAVEMNVQTEAVLRRWVGGLVQGQGKEMSGRDVQYFLEKTGPDMNRISTELEKLFCYTLQRNKITRQDIDAICVPHIDNHIFDMVDANATGDKGKAFRLYRELLELREPPMRILFMLTRQYRILYQVKGLAANRLSKAEIARKLGLHPYVAGKALQQMKQFDRAKIQQKMELSANLEEQVKTGLLTDCVAVELFLAEC